MAASPEVKAMFRALQALPENKVCADCSSRIPQWASCSYGTYICLECSGIHRSLGQCSAALFLAASLRPCSLHLQLLPLSADPPLTSVCLSVWLSFSLPRSLSLCARVCVRICIDVCVCYFYMGWSR